MKKLIFLLIVLISVNRSFAQDAVEINILDAYVTPEKPHMLKLSFFTDIEVTSKIILNNEHSYIVSDEYVLDHYFTIEITGLKFDSTQVPYYIEVTDRSGNITKSPLFDLALPEDNELLKGDSPNYFTMCCFGGVIFGLPSAGVVITDTKKYFSLIKEVPILTFYGSGYNYPVGVISVEYAYVFNAPTKNYFRVGYKHIFQPKYIEYISVGINGVSDMKGYNAASPQLSIGWFKIFNVFTVYSKYRFNSNFSDNSKNFHEISVGLFSSFFSFSL